jgi:hypothetical protein
LQVNINEISNGDAIGVVYIGGYIGGVYIER